MMDRKKAIELLPWYLAGSLEESEAREVSRLLQADETLRQELERTREAMEIFEARPSAEDLVRFAWGERPESADEIESYLAANPQATELIDAARSSLGLKDQASDRTSPRRNRASRLNSRTPWWAVAAALAAMIAGAGWFFAWRGQQSLERIWAAEEARLINRIESLEGAKEASDGRIADLEAQRIVRDMPRPNRPVLDVFPTDLNLRSADVGETLEISKSVREAVLILNSQSSNGYLEYRLTAADGQGREFWRSEGLQKQVRGEFTLILPLEDLPTSPVTLTLYGLKDNRLAPLERFPLRIVP